MAVSESLYMVRQRIESACARVGRNPSDVRVVAVTKTATAEQIREAVSAGLTELGENRVQVLEQHARELGSVPAVNWHLIGHLQRNKVRQVLGLSRYIHSVDSLRLAEEIQKCAAAMGVRVSVLLQVNAGEEQQKFGANLAEARELGARIAAMPNLELRGVMSMAPLTEDEARIRKAFANARETFEAIRATGVTKDCYRELSMGMSHDFEIAIEQGATILRLGSILFG